MEISDDFLNKLYEILATLNYNSERRELLEKVLKQFLIEKSENIDIKRKAIEIYEREHKFMERGFKDSEALKREWFKQEFLLLSNIPRESVVRYIIRRYDPFSKDFRRIYGIYLHTPLFFTLAILQLIELKKYELGFEDSIYKFSSKREYADLSFIAPPSNEYIETWKEIVTFRIEELKGLLLDLLSEKEIENAINLFSLDINQIPNDPEEIMFYFKPFLKIDDVLILLTPYYLLRSLPVFYELLLRKSQKYLNLKGKPFEKLVQDSLKVLPFNLLMFNVFYGKNKEYEADAIIKFRKSFWVVEITSHPPSLKALRGDTYSIRRDLKKAIEKCISQGKRFLEKLNESDLFAMLKDVETRGIIVIVDGIYPQLNANLLFSFFDEDVPIYVINWFDLDVLIEQPEIAQFEEFLLWRVQDQMPIICFDEKDYWAFYFDWFKTHKEIAERFELLKEQRITCFYISRRFNNKEYLDEIIDRETE